MSWCRRAATLTGRAWERSVWREARVLIAECPAPHLPASMESALRAVAASVARDRGWQGMGTVAFSLDDRSGVFRVLCAQATPLPGAAVADCEPVAAHALELRIDGGGDRHAPCTRLLVCDARRRAPIGPCRKCPARSRWTGVPDESHRFAGLLLGSDRHAAGSGGRLTSGAPHNIRMSSEPRLDPCQALDLRGAP